MSDGGTLRTLAVPQPQPSSLLQVRPPQTAPVTVPVANPLAPVDQTGTFESHRIIKSGRVLKRRKRTNAWDPVRLVLRPNLLSIYKDEEETQLRHQINLSEVTAVALRRDRKRKGEHSGVFGVFSPSRNFHLESETEQDATSWVDSIRTEARISDGDHQDMTVTSPGGSQNAFVGYGRPSASTGRVPWNAIVNRASSESPDPMGRSRSASGVESIEPISAPKYRKRNDPYEMSGNETGSYSDFSDAPIFGSLGDITATASHSVQRNLAVTETVPENSEPPMPVSVQPTDRSNFYMVGKATDEERVIWNGYLKWLKSRSGVRQWKKCWVVLRPKSLTLYKNEEEYAAILLIPLSSIVDAVEIDAISKTRIFCMQIITDDRTYRVSASSEEDLSKWLGAIKSVLARRRKASVEGPQPQ